jgi:hypothetical protein
MRRSSSKVRFLRFACGLGLLLLCSAAVPRPALGGEASADPVARGLELRRERRDAEALALFQSAYSAAAKPMILAQIALAEQALGRWLSAERDLASALGTRDPWVDANRGVLEKALSVIQSHLSWLAVTTNVESAEVSLDGLKLGSVRATPWRVTEGVHELALRVADGRSVTRSIEIAGGERAHFHVEVSELASLTAPGQLSSSAPKPVQPIQSANAPPATNIGQSFAFATTAVSVVALAEAVTASLLRADYVEQYNSDACAPDRSQKCAPYRDVADTLGTMAIVGYAVAGAAALGSVALFTSPYWYPNTGSRGGQAGLTVSGRF